MCPKPCESAAFSALAAAIERGGVYYNIAGSRPDEAIRVIVQTVRLPKGVDRAALCAAVLEREALTSTALDGGFALPHPRSPSCMGLNGSRVFVCFLESPVDWAAPDSQPVSTVFLILSASHADHLAILSEISRCIAMPSLTALLAARPSTEDMVAYLRNPVATK